MMELTRQWLEEANNLISDLRESKVITSKLFPHNEHLKPMNTLQKFWRVKLADFFSRDLTKLVPLSKVEDILERATQLEIDDENMHKKLFGETAIRGRDIKKQLKKHIQSNTLSYTGAKFFFGELASVGVFFPEAGPVRDLIWINSNLERKLSETLDREGLLKIQEMISMDKNSVDPELVSRIIDLIKEFERLELNVNSIVSRTHVDFKDLDLLEAIDKAIKNSKLVLPADRQFKDLFHSYSWVLKTSMEFSMKAVSLDQCIVELKDLIENKLQVNYKEVIQILTPISTITFSLTPVKEFLIFSKTVLWRAKVKNAFGDNEIDLHFIEELVSTVPQHIDKYPEAFNEYRLISGVIEKAKEWTKRCADYFSQIESLFSTTNSSSLNSQIKQLSSTMASLQAMYHKEDHKMIKNLNKTFEQLNQSESILVACAHISRIISGEVIDLEQFMVISEIVEANVKDDRKYSMLMYQFQKIQKEILPSLEQLNKITNNINGVTSTENSSKLDTKTILSRQKDKIKVFDIDFHLQKLSTRLNLGDFGDRIKIHMDDFFNWEKEAKNLIDQNPIKRLLKYSTKEQMGLLISKSRELTKCLVRSGLYSDLVEELMTYLWCLKVVNAFYLRSLDIAEYKSLIEKEVVHNKVSKSLMETLKSQVTAARFLMAFNMKYASTSGFRPSARTVKKIKILLKGCRVNLGTRVKHPKTFVELYDKLRRKVKEFRKQVRPSVEKVEDFIDIMKTEIIRFKADLIELQDMVNEMKGLLKQARKEQTTDDMIKRYRRMNISCIEFESLIRNKPLDKSLKTEYESVIQGNDTFEQLEQLQVKLETIDDVEWVNEIKEKLYIKKVKLIEDAIEDKSKLTISIESLKNLSMEGFQIGSKSEEFVRKLKMIQDLLKRVENKVKIMRDLPSEKLSKLKKKLFNVVDVHVELEELIDKNKRKDLSRLRSKSKKLMKRRPEVEREREREKSRRREKNMDLEKKRQKEKLTSVLHDTGKKKDHLEQLKNAIFSGVTQESSRPQRTHIETRAEKPNFLLEFSGFEEKEKENVKAAENPQRPANPNGIWGIFEGNFRDEISGRSVEEITLVTFDNWNKVVSFPKLPLSLSFREKIPISEISRRIETSCSLPSSEEQSRVLGGIVKCEGLSRIFLKQVFEMEDQTCLVAEYSRSTSLLIVATKDFQKKWFTMFEKNENLKTADSDFYFLIFCSEETPLMQINPFRIQRIENRENSSFAIETFKDLEIAAQKQKKKVPILASKQQKKPINEILSANNRAINRHETLELTEGR